MRLRTKLFFGIGSLFLLVALASFILPRIFIRGDVERVHAIFSQEIALQNKNARAIWQRLFNEKLDQSVIAINSTLRYVASTEAVKQGLQGDSKQFWGQMEALVADNPGVGYFQVSEKEGASFTVALNNAQFYPIKVQRLNEKMTLMIETDKGEIGPFLAVRASEKHEDYYLYPLDAHPLDLKLEGLIPGLPEDLAVTERTNIVRVYVEEFLTGIQGSPFAPGLPIGAATLFTPDSGSAILNKEIFFDQPVFDAAAYFHAHEPLSGALIGSGIELVDSPLLAKYFIVNVAPISDKLFLTLGQSFFSDIRTVSLVSEALVVFLDKQGNFEGAINSAKDDFPETFFDNVSFTTIVNTSAGLTHIGKNSYSYFELTSPIPLPVKAFVMIPDTAEPMFRLQDVVNNNLITIYHALSSQLFATSLLLLGVALILLSYISKRITRPITILAGATEQVAKGQFVDIRLPAVKESENEVSVLTQSFSNMIKGLQDREKIRNLLDKVVSKEIAAEIIKGNVQLGGESKVVTILFADIRGFTKITEQMDPQELITKLNAYMTVMTGIIEQSGGVIDKYIGDAIMALYGAPVAVADGPERAIRAAIAMMEQLKQWNRDRKIPLQIGIGIHTGKVVAGNMGADTRLNYTVLGANVNFASRLCSSAAPMEIRVSEETLKASGLKDRLLFNVLPPAMFKGFSSPIETYAILGIK